jgi:hypothetical protein
MGSASRLSARQLRRCWAPVEWVGTQNPKRPRQQARQSGEDLGCGVVANTRQWRLDKRVSRTACPCIVLTVRGVAGAHNTHTEGLVQPRAGTACTQTLRGGECTPLAKLSRAHERQHVGSHAAPGMGRRACVRPVKSLGQCRNMGRGKRQNAGHSRARLVAGLVRAAPPRGAGRGQARSGGGISAVGGWASREPLGLAKVAVPSPRAAAGRA